MKYIIKMIWEDGIHIESQRFNLIYDSPEDAQRDIDETGWKLGFKKYVIIPLEESEIE